MSRKTKRAYLRLCPEKRRKKKNSVHKGLKRNRHSTFDHHEEQENRQIKVRKMKPLQIYVEINLPQIQNFN